MAGSFAHELRDRSGELWQRMSNHRFVEAIGDGTLSLERFSYFMGQDYLFLIEYSKVLALAAAKSSDLESMGRFAKLLDETLNSEMALHRSFCKDFGIGERELERTIPGRATSGYTGFLVRTGFQQGIEQISAALLPCQWSYDEIGRSLAMKMSAPPDSFHARWVAGYDSEEYHGVTEWLIRFVDRIGLTVTPDLKEGIQNVFDESCRHEIAFWDAAWNLAR
ncbi:MAG: thiaminase II [Chloroflexi bacterium]|nr:thiaminase II [Chloroflexota bacterium]